MKLNSTGMGLVNSGQEDMCSVVDLKTEVTQAVSVSFQTTGSFSRRQF